MDEMDAFNAKSVCLMESVGTVCSAIKSKAKKGIKLKGWISIEYSMISNGYCPESAGSVRSFQRIRIASSVILGEQKTF